MKGSCVIKINCISKPKIVFYKCTNSVRRLHISSDGQTGSITTKMRSLRCSSKVLCRSSPLWFLCLLFRFALIRLVCRSLSGRLSQGAPGVREELWWKWVGGVGHPIWNLCLVSIDFLFERTTPVTIGEEGLLVVLPHGFVLLARLGLK